MKKLFLALALTTSIIACSKDSDETCYWTDQNGNDWDHYPTPAEIQQLANQCSCTPTFDKWCE